MSTSTNDSHMIKVKRIKYVSGAVCALDQVKTNKQDKPSF